MGYPYESSIDWFQAKNKKEKKTKGRIEKEKRKKNQKYHALKFLFVVNSRKK